MNCPCGSGMPFADCCEPLLSGTAPAQTAQALMRSRYTAFVVLDSEYLWRSWHPRTRPTVVTLPDDVTWTGLRILATVAGEPGDDEGEVTFEAHYLADDEPAVLREHSRFLHRAGRWMYLDGT